MHLALKKRMLQPQSYNIVKRYNSSFHQNNHQIPDESNKKFLNTGLIGLNLLAMTAELHMAGTLSSAWNLLPMIPQLLAVTSISQDLMHTDTEIEKRFKLYQQNNKEIKELLEVITQKNIKIDKLEKNIAVTRALELDQELSDLKSILLTLEKEVITQTLPVINNNQTLTKDDLSQLIHTSDINLDCLYTRFLIHFAGMLSNGIMAIPATYIFAEIPEVYPVSLLVLITLLMNFAWKSKSVMFLTQKQLVQVLKIHQKHMLNINNEANKS